MPTARRSIAEIQAAIQELVRKGAYPETAAQAEGISPVRLARWTASRRPEHISFTKRLHQAHAAARADAEARAHERKLHLWLKNGPAPRQEWGDKLPVESADANVTSAAGIDPLDVVNALLPFIAAEDRPAAAQVLAQLEDRVPAAENAGNS